MASDYLTLEKRILAFIIHGEGNFEELFLEVFRFQQAHHPAYANFCRDLPLPQSWCDIPAVPQSAFKHFALRSFPESQTIRTFRTSGTTGGGYGEHHFCSLELYKAAALEGWKHAGLPPVLHAALLAPPEEAPHSSLSCMAGWLKPKAFLIRNGKLDELSPVFDHAGESVAIFGTALAFLNLFEEKGGGSLPHLPTGSMVIETGGYKGSGRDISKSTLYALFEKYLGLAPGNIVNEYGMTELSSQFYSYGIGTPHSGAPWIKAQVIDPVSGKETEEGMTGILKIFDLANLGSVCAILTQDLAIRRKDGFELVGRNPSALPRGCSRAADAVLNSRS